LKECRVLSLIAQGPETGQRCKWLLSPGESAVLGRSVDCELPIPWDSTISRRHARLVASETDLSIERLPEAANALFFGGEISDKCLCSMGEHFVVGRTTVMVDRAEFESTAAVDLPIETMTFERRELQRVAYTDADRRIEVLAQLPDLIRGTRTDREMQRKLLNLLLAGVTDADAVAIAYLDQDSIATSHWLRRRETEGEVVPSARLVRDAVGFRKQTVLHIWESAATDAGYTQSAGIDWAFCTPAAFQVQKRSGIYVAGRFEQDSISHMAERRAQLKADIRFTEFVAEIVSTVLRENEWERQKAVLQQFLPAPVLEALGEELDTDLLEPRECDVTVLFCDLRGFSRRAEESAGQLMELLERVRAALELMTCEILRFGGVTGDFLGDATLGFWGWPFASAEAPLNACRAALAIRRAFNKVGELPDHPLADFQMGIGIAHGPAVAGKIGAGGQVKATVFGPVVNLSSRLEGMTKQLRVPILLDEATANLVRPRLSAEEGRIRRLARVLPYGMDNAVEVSELLLTESESPELSTELLQIYERGVEQFTTGDWEQAYAHFHQMPASDRAQDFLSVLIAQHNRVSPPGWDGIVRLPSK